MDVAPPAAQPPLRVLFLGRLAEHKDPLMFIDAIAAARSHGADVLGEIVGAGPLASEVAAAAERVGGITFTGWLNDPYRAIERAHALLLPSRNEGCPTVCLEAAALGRPSVVRAGLDGVTEALGAAVFCPRPEASAVDFGRCLHELARDPCRVSQVGLAAKARYEQHFGVLPAAQRLARVYEAVIAA